MVHSISASGTRRLISVLLASLITPLAMAQESRQLLDLAKRAASDGCSRQQRAEERARSESPDRGSDHRGREPGKHSGHRGRLLQARISRPSGLKGSLGGGAIALLGIAYGRGESSERDGLVPSRDLDDLRGRAASSLGLVDVLIDRGRSQGWSRGRILEINDGFAWSTGRRFPASVPILLAKRQLP